MVRKFRSDAQRKAVMRRLKSNQPVRRFPKIQIISNVETVDWSKVNPVSRAFHGLSKNLHSSGMSLELVNQDSNRVYFRIKNNINKYVTPVLDYSYDELLHLNMYDIASLKDAVWLKTTGRYYTERSYPDIPHRSGDDRANYVFEDELF